MNKSLRTLTLAVLLGGSIFTAQAEGFGHLQTLSVAGRNLPLTDTSARILGNKGGTAPQLVDDITDGLGKNKIPGYKIQIMSRAYSLAHQTRAPRQGQTAWSDNRHIHRGSKLLVGIPVKGGQMDLAGAQLLGMAVISDAAVPDNFKAEDKIRPRGKQLATREAKISSGKLKIERLVLPDMASGEKSGGGVKLSASVVIDGQTAVTDVNSTFTEFDTAKGDARGFAADKRLFQ
ncbi:hypothetical protein BWD09_04995 [Neisseria dentiae]|uniref:Uncharacterized protein n=1 Tax=Neisseria dentiae TaxID=194197 RepID=A0A1X3DD20_9NEIS|nr:hypothetical protein [Neisseria dentiae]OSI17790.1 hypothetical protein BWD09_04995 [Neisseria dentiae]QMT44693.1 hypothetical protein H3L92_09600 [Neisseria dentiae]STZ50406.1 Uncharacterised protein [Neisseria dentiae]